MPSDTLQQGAEAEPPHAISRPLLVTTSPHIHSPESIPRIMWTVSLALIPAAAWGVYAFGFRALWVMLLGIASAVGAEAAIQKLRKRPVTVNDGSAFLTGLLVAFVLPVHMPWWVPVTASAFAIAIVKQCFGGLGCNVWNPALMGRAFVLAAWAATLTVGAGWPTALWYHRTDMTAGRAVANAPIDGVTGATPLTQVKAGLPDRKEVGEQIAKLRPAAAPEALGIPFPCDSESAKERVKSLIPPLGDLAVGFKGGCIGEVSPLALLAGGIVLLFLGYVRWQVPVFYIGTVALLAFVLGVPVAGGRWTPVQANEVLLQPQTYLVSFPGLILFEILTGGLFLGAFFMATDMVTSPVTAKGLTVYAIGCGLLTFVIRRYGGYPEGVCYAILLMNTATPLINRYTKPKVFGKRPKQ